MAKINSPVSKEIIKKVVMLLGRGKSRFRPFPNFGFRVYVNRKPLNPGRSKLSALEDLKSIMT
jgi:hypothetical protein